MNIKRVVAFVAICADMCFFVICGYVHRARLAGIYCCAQEGKMFDDNWYLFLLIVMLAFFADGNISDREATVMLAILFALTLTNNLNSDASTTGCFCNK